IGRPGWDHPGPPCKPGCWLCQDIALLAQLPVLTPQTGQLLALGAGRAVRSAAFIAIGLTNPVPDRLGSRFELARQLLRCSPRSDQINHLSPEFRRIGSVTLRHRWHLLLKWKGVDQTGASPDDTEKVTKVPYRTPSQSCNETPANLALLSLADDANGRLGDDRVGGLSRLQALL